MILIGGMMFVSALIAYLVTGWKGGIWGMLLSAIIAASCAVTASLLIVGQVSPSLVGPAIAASLVTARYLR